MILTLAGVTAGLHTDPAYKLSAIYEAAPIGVNAARISYAAATPAGVGTSSSFFRGYRPPESGGLNSRLMAVTPAGVKRRACGRIKNMGLQRERRLACTVPVIGAPLRKPETGDSPPAAPTQRPGPHRIV